MPALRIFHMLEILKHLAVPVPVELRVYHFFCTLALPQQIFLIKIFIPSYQLTHTPTVHKFIIFLRTGLNIQIQIICNSILFVLTTSIHIKVREVLASDSIRPVYPSRISALFDLDLAGSISKILI